MGDVADRLARDLAAVVGTGHVLTGPDVLAGYTTDWTRRYGGTAACVARPGSAAEVAGVLRACARHRAPVVPQGGNTGLAGGSVPGHEGTPVVLSARRLRRLDPVDTLAAQVTAGAGVTIAELRSHASGAGLEYGVDLASRDSATVGGTIATNAGGLQTLRYGRTRAQLLGVEAVLADGSVISRLGGVEADSTGYDLAQLITGSEGTLAVVTAARLRLWPAETPPVTILAGVAGIEAAAALYAEIRSRVPGLRAAEYFEAAGLALVRAHTGLPAPLPRDYPAYLLAEGPAEHAERMAEIPALAEAAVAADAQGRAALRAYRERHTEAISAAGIPHKLDIAAPLTRLPALRDGLGDAVQAASARPGPRTIVFGHVGAGNMHVNVLGPDPDDDAVDEAVMALAVAHGGTISAEHGIGRAKARSLHLDRSPAEIAAMRTVKAALDPAGLLNPGVLLA